MTTVTKFTVSVPTVLLEEADRKLIRPDEGRSGLVRRLIEKALREEREREDVERYVRSYRDDPETEAELGYLDVIAAKSLADVPWEE